MQIQPLFRCVAGLDVHLALVVVTIISAESLEAEPKVETREFGAFKRDRRAMAEWIASFHPDEVSMESTGIYWKRVYVALERVGICAKVVNAYHVSKVPGRKTDFSDSLWLAMLTRAGLLKSSFVPDESVRHLRLASRHHTGLVDELARHKNRLLKVLNDGGMRLTATVSDAHGVACRAMIKAILAGQTPEQAVRLAGKLKSDREELILALDHELTPVHLYMAQTIQREIDFLESEIAELERYLSQQLASCQPLIDLLLTLPGMDQLSASKLLVEIGTDMRAFARPDHLAVWSGVCPGNEQSAGTRKRAKTQRGNHHVRRILVEVAHAAARTHCYFKERFDAWRIRLGYKKSVVAVAHKIIKIVHVMLSRKVPYQDKSADYEALLVRRNRSRWIKALKKFGHLPETA